MHVWKSWEAAIEWCWKTAKEDCSILTSDWVFGEIRQLKYQNDGFDAQGYSKGNLFLGPYRKG